MNGHIQNQKPSKAWQSLVKTCLPPQDQDVEFWWQLTGYHLAKMIEAADYSIERQYEILLFHYHWIVRALFSPFHTKSFFTEPSFNHLYRSPDLELRPMPMDVQNGSL